MRNESFDESADCLLATVDRSGRVESRHHGAVVVVRGDEVVHAWGDHGRRIYTRSAVKPLQALPLLERGVAERHRWSDRELALISASHNSTPEHIEVVRGLLAVGGFSEQDLQCGPHAPFDRAASLAIARSGGKPGRIHNNCSGKHAGFLHLAQDLGVPAEAYLDPESASQQLIKRTVAEMAGIEPGTVDVGLDGCGAPTLGLPLVALARAFWGLANPDHLPSVRAGACRRMFEAISRAPVYLAGRGRLCTALIESAPGRIYPKNGAEGVYAAGVAGGPDGGFGIAIKVTDGHERGYIPVVVDLLARMGLWPEVPESLADFRRIPIRNTQKIVVGHVQSALPTAP